LSLAVRRRTCRSITLKVDTHRRPSRANTTGHQRRRRHFICPIIQQYAHLHRYNFRRAGQQGPTRTAALKRAIKQLLGTYSITPSEILQTRKLQKSIFSMLFLKTFEDVKFTVDGTYLSRSLVAAFTIMQCSYFVGGAKSACLCIHRDVAETMVTKLSPFCEYNMTQSVELMGENLLRYSIKTKSGDLRQCRYDH